MSSAQRLIISVLAVFFAIMTYGAQAQGPVSAPSLVPGSAPSPVPVPGSDCLDALLNLSSCLTYVEEPSNLTVPETGCCPSLSSLVDNNPICLCQLLGNTSTFGITINTTKALMLPAACHVVTPPVSLCSAISPVPSPMGFSPAPTSGGPEAPTGSSSSAGSATAAAAPLSGNTSSSSPRATGLVVLAGLSVVAIF